VDLAYRKFKRRRVGPCNVCGAIGPLTWDHVPPKGGIELEPVEINRVAGLFISGIGQESSEVSHDGLKFRTLCAEHNSYLGSHYDPALNDFALTVGRFLRTNLSLPQVLHVEARPSAIVRAVLGHILAARLSSMDSFCDHVIRETILAPDGVVPDDINIFYWIYPYAHQIVLRNAVMPLRRGDFSAFQQFGLLKYFPIAYLVTTAHTYEGLDSLTMWRHLPSSATVRVPVNLGGIRDPYWPEAATPDNFLFGGEDLMQSVEAYPAREKLANCWSQANHSTMRRPRGLKPTRR
jgi:hypothetical protein